MQLNDKPIKSLYIMKTYIVTETNHKDNTLLRTWVCTTKESAEKCLKKRYNIACTYNRLAGVDDPTDCLEHDFFFWTLTNGMEIRYNITKADIFEN